MERSGLQHIVRRYAICVLIKVGDDSSKGVDAARSERRCPNLTLILTLNISKTVGQIFFVFEYVMANDNIYKLTKNWTNRLSRLGEI
jgi:hypothetical protein